jgi:MFS family permease
VTITPHGPGGEWTGRPVGERRHEASGRRQGVSGRWLVVAAVVAGALLLFGVGGSRTWWAHRVHDITGGDALADYLLGLAVGLLPVVGVAVGRVGAQGGRRLRRMFLGGAAGFLLTYFLSPSLASIVDDSAVSHLFRRVAPGYLSGVATAVALWLVLLVVAFLRLRARVRHHLARFERPT